MLLQLVDKKKRILEKSNLKCNQVNLKRTYNALRKSERVHRFKTQFSENIFNKHGEPISGKYMIQYRIFIIFRIRTNRIVFIRPEKHWLITFFHEFAHVLAARDFGFIDHGPSFKAYHKYLIERYFDIVLKELLKLQREDKEKSKKYSKRYRELCVKTDY